jgi:hypothetical protein
MNTDLALNTIVKYKTGKTYYVLIEFHDDEKIAFIKHKNGSVYRVDNIDNLESVKNIKVEDFNIECNHKEFVKKIYGVEYEIIKDLIGEHWKEIFFLKGIFVSNKGRIKSNRGLLKESLLRFYQNENNHNFIRIRMYENGKEITYYYDVAHLVAIAFVPNPKKFKLVILKDNNPNNLSVENIEWTDNGIFQYYPKIKFKIHKSDKTSTSDFSGIDGYDGYTKYGGPIDEYGERVDDDFIDDVLGGIPEAIWNIT